MEIGRERCTTKAQRHEKTINFAEVNHLSLRLNGPLQYISLGVSALKTIL